MSLPCRMLVDPDAPGGIGGDHKWRHFLHWLVSRSLVCPACFAASHANR